MPYREENSLQVLAATLPPYVWYPPLQSRQSMLQIPIRPSPSLLYSNLCSVRQGLAYIHTRSVRLQPVWQQ